MKSPLKFLQPCFVASLLLVVPLSVEAANPAAGPKVEPGNTFGREIKDLIEEKDLDTPLALVSGKLPQYPGELRKTGPAGYVVVEFIINRSGDVTQIQVVESSRREFEMPALRSVQTWKFKPGQKDKRAVNVLSTQRLEFEPPKK